jgi:hypothetical protein
LKFRGIDLTRCTLQELQKLVVATTNVMVPSNNSALITPPLSSPNTAYTPNITNTTITNNTTNTADSTDVKKSIITKDTTLSEITNSEKKIFHSEPVAMEDVKIIPNTGSQDLPKISNPIKTVMGPLKRVARHDSGYEGS